MRNEPSAHSAALDRRFDCFPAAVLGFVIDSRERLLLLKRPGATEHWEVVSGALEHGESVLEGAQREIIEEAGPDLDLNPLGCFHVESFPLVADLPPLLSVHYLFSCSGGTVVPGSDMTEAIPGWFTLDEITRLGPAIKVPKFQRWLFERAFRCHADWRKDEADLQANWDQPDAGG